MDTGSNYENPLSDLISDEIYDLLNSRNLINEKSVRDYQIKKKFKALREQKVSASDAIERIREELNLGKTPRASVAAGYERATLTILDANVTTLIAALVLFQFGTGPVKGFAVTLSLGIASSLFTALILTRLIFDYFLVVRNAKTLSI